MAGRAVVLFVARNRVPSRSLAALRCLRGCERSSSTLARTAPTAPDAASRLLVRRLPEANRWLPTAAPWRFLSSDSSSGRGERTDEASTQASEERRATEDAAAAQQQKEASRTWTVPNIITAARICSCPLLAGLIMTSQYELAMVGLGIASFSDWLDGHLARKWDQKSVLGGFLDPLADKTMMTCVSLALGQQGLLPPVLVLIVVGRDALLVGGSLVYRAKTKRPEDAFFDVVSLDYKIKPSLLSKYNTALQFATLWLALTHAVYLVPGDAVFGGLCLATGAVTVVSGVAYLVDFGMRPTSRIRQRLQSGEERLEQRLAAQEEKIKERQRRLRALTKLQLEKQRARIEERAEQVKERTRRVLKRPHGASGGSR